MGLNPARVACEVFSTDTRKPLSIQCYTHVGVRAKIKSILYCCLHQENRIYTIADRGMTISSSVNNMASPSKSKWYPGKGEGGEWSYMQSEPIHVPLNKCIFGGRPSCRKILSQRVNVDAFQQSLSIQVTRNQLMFHNLQTFASSRDLDHVYIQFMCPTPSVMLMNNLFVSLGGGCHVF